jgi:hypothetical protein
MDLDSQSTLDTAKLLQGIYIITIKKMVQAIVEVD